MLRSISVSRRSTGLGLELVPQNPTKKDGNTLGGTIEERPMISEEDYQSSPNTVQKPSRLLKGFLKQPIAIKEEGTSDFFFMRVSK